jgi:hypothetical protein
MESLVAYASLGGSVFSTIATFYFWLVKANGERPNLKPYVIDREFFLGASTPQQRQIGFKVGLVVANYSTLPNSILKASLQCRGRDGAWIDVAALSFDKQTPVPYNLPPMHTALLRINGNLIFPYTDTLEDNAKTLGNYLRTHLAEPRVLRVELQSLSSRVDRFEVALPDAV